MSFNLKKLIIFLSIPAVVLLVVFGAWAVFEGGIGGLRNDKVSDSGQNQNSEIKFVSSKKDFKSGEEPELKFEYIFIIAQDTGGKNYY